MGFGLPLEVVKSLNIDFKFIDFDNCSDLLLF